MQLTKDQENRLYISESINPYIEKLIFLLLKEKPKASVEYMIKWLETEGMKIYNEKYPSNKEKKNPYDEKSEESEEDEYINQIPPKIKKGEKDSRNSVSAEAYGQFNKKEDFKPKVHPKSVDKINRISKELRNNFMFSSLENSDILIVVNSFLEKKYSKGATIIKQGEEGSHLFYVDSGELDCFRKNDLGDPVYLKTYMPGDTFGELALLYNTPRAATVTTRSDCVLFELDRECFNFLVKEAMIKKREKYEAFLSKIELLKSLEPYERMTIADALRPIRFQKGEYVVREGEKGDNFFFIEEGEAIATKKINESEETVYKYKEGDYFGELALLRETPRAANIIATSEIKLVSLDRQSFKRMIGPMEDILKRNFQRYEKFMFN